MSILTKSHAFRLLTALPAFDAVEVHHIARTLVFLNTTDAPFFRDTLAGHLTASAVLLDITRTQMLLIWHEKLQRWLQPGGHCEPDDPTLQAAAKRELLEESGLPAALCVLDRASPFDVDVHLIPARAAEPDHWHYDIRFLFVLSEPVETMVGACANSGGGHGGAFAGPHGAKVAALGG
jgi:ADP-ribose pyrophosphatase YjhB (NUDIX family)